LEPRETPVFALIDRCIRAHTAEAAQRGVDLVGDVPEELPVVRCDPETIERVLGNLVSNAFRYTPEGGSIQLMANPLDGRVEFVVADSGAGFDPEGLARADEPFWRRDESRTTDEYGVTHAGLGLAIAKGLLELQGGELEIANADHGGGRVSFVLTAC
jgi:two-component system sensor histidine kinase VicK